MRTTVIHDTKDHITRKAVEEDGALLTPPDSLLIVVRSGILVHTFPVARTAVETSFNQDMKAIRVNERVALAQYVFSFLQARERQILSQGVKRGATVHSVQSGFIESLEIPLPAPREQRRIVELLDQAHTVRRLRTKADSLTTDILPAIFRKMFGNPTRNANGWPTENLLTICSPRQWPTISSRELLESGFPVYGANGRIGFYDSFNHEKATVLITCRGATCGTINVCEPKSYVTGNAMSLDDPDESKITNEFLEWFLRVRGLRDTITGAAQPQITRANLAIVEVPTPPKPLVNTFTEKARALRLIEAEQAASRTNIETLFQTMLHRAFTGELTAGWREAHMKELLAEMEIQSKILKGNLRQ